MKYERDKWSRKHIHNVHCVMMVRAVLNGKIYEQTEPTHPFCMQAEIKTKHKQKNTRTDKTKKEKEPSHSQEVNEKVGMETFRRCWTSCSEERK